MSGSGYVHPVLFGSTTASARHASTVWMWWSVTMTSIPRWWARSIPLFELMPTSQVMISEVVGYWATAWSTFSAVISRGPS